MFRLFPASDSELNKVFRYSPFAVGVSSAAPPCNQLENVADSSGSCNQPENVADTSGSSKNLERWEDSDVRLLITTWADHKHMFGGKATKKDVFEKIAKHFTKISGRFVSGEQCMRKWGKLTSKHKEIEDHNNKTGNDKRSWKFHEELTECLAKDATVTPVYTMESNVQVDDHNSVSCNSGHQSDDESSSESLTGETCSDSSGKRGKAGKKRFRKKARSRSSAAEMLDFLKSYSEKREKVEEEKLQVLKEMKEEKTAFFNLFLSIYGQKVNMSIHK